MLDRHSGDGDWSTEAAGLSGRLRVRFEDLRPGLRHAVYLELRNHQRFAIAVTNQPRVDAVVSTPSGKPVPAGGIRVSGPVTAPQPAVIPTDAYLGIRIDIQTAGMPTREQGAVLLAIGGSGWMLAAGGYVLTAAIEYPGREADGATGDWSGRLDLPPVRIDVRF